jgi:hypothetical protein
MFELPENQKRESLRKKESEMTKVIVKKIERATARQISASPTRNSSTGTSKVSSTSTRRALSANSDTFSDDLTLAFGKNVASARRENKRLFGSSDFVPSKS